jgi:two-component system, NarL family, invasion response regulator UvrY
MLDLSLINVFLVDDTHFLRERLKHLVADEPGILVTGEASSGRAALAGIARHLYDLVLLDISLPDLTGFDVLLQIKQTQPTLPVLMLTTHCEPQYVAKALRLGAVGYVTKDQIDRDLIKAIRTAVAGHTDLVRQ